MFNKNVFKIIAVFTLFSVIVGCTPVNDVSNEKLNDEVAVGQNDSVTEEIDDNSKISIEFADVEKAKELLALDGPYLQGLTEFDLASKVLVDSKTTDGYIESAQSQVLAWNDTEKQEISTHMNLISKKMNALGVKVKMPDVVYFIKTTGKEEGGASGYTRGDSIILRESRRSKTLVAHELFHIISRNNPDKAEDIYKVFGFKASELELPVELQKNIITNPDAVDLNYTINVKHNDKNKEGVLLIHSTRPFEGGSFFEYLNLGFYFEDPTKPFEMSDMVAIEDVTDFIEQTGTNTSYNIHPEELAADHFTFILFDEAENYPNPELIEGVQEVLIQ